MEIEVKFIDGSSVILKKDEWDKAYFNNGFFFVNKEEQNIICAPKESVLYYKTNQRAN